MIHRSCVKKKPGHYILGLNHYLFKERGRGQKKKKNLKDLVHDFLSFVFGKNFCRGWGGGGWEGGGQGR